MPFPRPEEGPKLGPASMASNTATKDSARQLELAEDFFKKFGEIGKHPISENVRGGQTWDRYFSPFSFTVWRLAKFWERMPSLRPVHCVKALIGARYVPGRAWEGTQCVWSTTDSMFHSSAQLPQWMCTSSKLAKLIAPHSVIDAYWGAEVLTCLWSYKKMTALNIVYPTNPCCHCCQDCQGCHGQLKLGEASFRSEHLITQTQAFKLKQPSI